MDELGIDTNASFLADVAQPMPPAAVPAPPQLAPKAPRPPASIPRPIPVKPAAVVEKQVGVPIILVPSGMGSQVLVNMYNSKKFLEECAFEPWEDNKNVRQEVTAVSAYLTNHAGWSTQGSDARNQTAVRRAK